MDLVNVETGAEEGSVGGFSSTSNSHSHNDGSQVQQGHDSPTQKPWVRRSAGIVALLASAILPFVVFHVMRSAERRSYERKFRVLSSKAKETVGLNIARMVSAADSLAVETTSHAIETNSTWPFVSLWDFGPRAESMIILSEAGILLNVHPFVQEEDRLAWEEYVQENAASYINETFTHQNEVLINSGQQPRSPDPEPELGEIFREKGYPSRIYKTDFFPDGSVKHSYDDTPGPYFPSWQAYPINIRVINYNYRSYPPTLHATNAMIQNEQAVFEGIGAFPPRAPVFNDFLRVVTKNSSAFYEGEAVSVFNYPVFDSFDRSSRKMVGAISITLILPLYFRKLLPDGTPPIQSYLSSTCGPGMGMRIEGAVSVYLGLEDFHDKNYDDMEDTYNLSDIVANPKFTFSDTTVPVDLDYCSMTLHLYPTKEFENSSYTNGPLIFAIIAGGLLLAFGLVLVTYGCIIRRRYRRIINEAIKSGSYVSSIFPETIRDRLMQIASENKKSKKCVEEKPLNPYQLPISKNTSICDCYSDCTVFFAKISGFSRWSTNRCPDDIFTLLEAIFQTMDRIVKRRQVFKVETIADSYLAVTGLPNRQEDHAWRIAKFSRACIETVDRILSEIAESLGPDTKDLKLQIGLHSGPVTGGVMGGQEKARFQLFGDTVNTASRLMTTGTAGRVHLSKSTAMIIASDACHANRIERRQDAVYAKGKGNIETYWLKIASLSTIKSNGTSVFSEEE